MLRIKLNVCCSLLIPDLLTMCRTRTVLTTAYLWM